MCDWYSIFDRHPYRLHMAQYYSTKLKVVMWINGKACEQDEPVQAMDRPASKCGVEGTGCENLVLMGICNVRSGLGNDKPDPTHPMYRGDG